MKWIYGFIRWLSILIIALMLFFSVTTASYVHLSEHSEILPENPLRVLLLLLVTVGIALAVFFFGKKLTHHIKLSHVLAFYSIVLMVFILYFQLLPRADQESVSTVARHILNGDWGDFEMGGYMYLYPHQIGLVYYLAAVFYVFGGYNYTAVQILNGVYMGVTLWYLYKIAERYFDKNGMLTAVMTALFFPYTFYVLFVYGSVLHFMFAVISLYYCLNYLDDHRVKNLILMILWMMGSIFFKNNALIFLIAEAGMIFLSMVEEKKWKRLPLLALIIVGYLAVGLVNKGLIRTAGKGDIEGAPKINWIAMGMQESSLAAGWWNSYNTDLYREYSFDMDSTVQAAKRDIKERASYFLEHPAYAFDFYREKIISQWNDVTFESLWILRSGYSESGTGPSQKLYTKFRTEGNLLDEVYYFCCKIFILLVFLGNLVYLFTHRLEKKNALLYVAFIGGFLFHLIWEGKSQYTIFYVMILFPYTIEGIESVINRVKIGEWIKNGREENA